LLLLNPAAHVGPDGFYFRLGIELQHYAVDCCGQPPFGPRVQQFLTGLAIPAIAGLGERRCRGRSRPTSRARGAAVDRGGALDTSTTADRSERRSRAICRIAW
jgi:hypothetical protein